MYGIIVSLTCTVVANVCVCKYVHVSVDVCNEVDLCKTHSMFSSLLLNFSKI